MKNKTNISYSVVSISNSGGDNVIVNIDERFHMIEPKLWTCQNNCDSTEFRLKASRKSEGNLGRGGIQIRSILVEDLDEVISLVVDPEETAHMIKEFGLNDIVIECEKCGKIYIRF